MSTNQIHSGVFNLKQSLLTRSKSPQSKLTNIEEVPYLNQTIQNGRITPQEESIDAGSTEYVAASSSVEN